MKMKKVTLDDSILDFDKWLDEEILNELTEQVFGVKIVSNNFYFTLPNIISSKSKYSENSHAENNSEKNYLEYSSLGNTRSDYSLDLDKLKEFAA